SQAGVHGHHASGRHRFLFAAGFIEPGGDLVIAGAAGLDDQGLGAGFEVAGERGGVDDGAGDADRAAVLIGGRPVRAGDFTVVGTGDKVRIEVDRGDGGRVIVSGRADVKGAGR